VPEPSGFPSYIEQAIERAGYSSPTAFAKAAGLQPSVVLRWVGGETRPTAATAQHAAPLLGMTVTEMMEAAYPPDADAATLRVLHPRAMQVDRLLGDGSPLPEADRMILERLLGHVLDPWLTTVRKRARRNPP